MNSYLLKQYHRNIWLFPIVKSKKSDWISLEASSCMSWYENLMFNKKTENKKSKARKRGTRHNMWCLISIKLSHAQGLPWSFPKYYAKRQNCALYILKIVAVSFKLQIEKFRHCYCYIRECLSVRRRKIKFWHTELNKFPVIECRRVFCSSVSRRREQR